MKLQSTLLLIFALTCNAFAAKMTLEAGDYRLVFSEHPERWSIVQVFYQGHEIGTPTGYYGNVLAPQNGKYIGAGHTEGGTETVLTCELQIDGHSKDVGEYQYQGEQLSFHKISMLDNMKMSARYILTAEELKVVKSFETVAEQPVHLLYLFQFCWNVNSSDYLFRRMNGSLGKGKFSNDTKMRVYGEPHAYFFSQFFPEFKVGVLNYLPEFGKFTGKNLLWDQLRYHKYYFWLDLPELLPANYRSPEITMIVRGFPAESEQAWETAALQQADELLIRYPFAPTPQRLKPLPEDQVILPPANKFQCRKFNLPLDADTQYGISFEICKTPGISSKLTDHCLLVGYYNAERVFKTLATFAANVKADQEYHFVQGAFKTPASREPFCLYIYNSHSAGTVSIRNLEINKVQNNP
ncbi:MAG: hypothetical protein GX946_06325 [Oligosphaeraceae bacterium]|nr:hypothetical protein [Oligosphaeraceae bacterium]